MNNRKKTNEFLLQSFKEYYFKNLNSFYSPTEIKRREFGFKMFDSRVIRHISFSELGNLKAYILQYTPFDIFCSNAYYEFPTFPINEKRWLGADLIFDIDLKDLILPCQADHTFFICAQCDHVYTKFNKICIQCSSTKFDSTIVPCMRCVSRLKTETKNLLLFLGKDFGVDMKSIEIFFSGNTGFHVYVIDDNFLLLDSKSRSDLAGYMMGKNLSLSSLGVIQTKLGYKIKIPLSGLSSGWRKRIAQKLKLSNCSNDHLNKFIKKIGGYDVFKAKVDEVVESQGIKIDPQVTMDIHRIFRMPGSINSKSGLSKVKCNNIDTFDPMIDSCMLVDTNNIDLNIKIPLKLNFKGKKYSFDKSITTVPTSVGIYLLLKRLADLA